MENEFKNELKQIGITLLLTLYGIIALAYVVKINFNWFVRALFPNVSELAFSNAIAFVMLLCVLIFFRGLPKSKSDNFKGWERKDVIRIILIPLILLLIASMGRLIQILAI